MAKAKDTPTQEELREKFDYDPETGQLLRKYKKMVKPAGSPHKDGYIGIRYNGRWYLAHRLIWVYHKGPIHPSLVIDHEDGNGLNNRIGNLNLATHSENAKNRKKNSAIRTVSKYIKYSDTSKRFHLIMKFNNRTRRFGSYLTLGEAEAARANAYTKLRAESTQGQLVFDE